MDRSKSTAETTGRFFQTLGQALERRFSKQMEWLNQHRNRLIFNSLSALLAALAVHFLTGAIPYYPDAWCWPLSIAVGLLWVLRPNLGVVLAMGVFLLPIAYNSLTLAVAYVLLQVAVAIIEVWALSPYAFLILAGVTVIYLRPEFAVLLCLAPLLAGFMGPRRGTVLGALTCFWVELLGVMGGKTSLGLLALGSSPASTVPLRLQPVEMMTDFRWLTAQVDAGKLDTDLIARIFAPFPAQPALLAQIAVWALAAGIMGALLSRKFHEKIPARYTALFIGAAVLLAGAALLPGLFHLKAAALGAVLLGVFVPVVIAGLPAPWLELGVSVLAPPSAPEFPPVEEREDAVQPEAGTWPQGSYSNLEGLSTRKSSAEMHPHDVFISYSSNDRPVADGICASLEATGLHCWMAPRDVGLGEDWPTAIANAIASSKVLVLIFSGNSNRSEEVSRELYLAASSRISIIPFKIEEVKPEPGKAYYLGRTHWLEAGNPPSPEQVQRLIDEIHLLIVPEEPCMPGDSTVVDDPKGGVEPVRE